MPPSHTSKRAAPPALRLSSNVRSPVLAAFSLPPSHESEKPVEGLGCPPAPQVHRSLALYGFRAASMCWPQPAQAIFMPV